MVREVVILATVHPRKIKQVPLAIYRCIYMAYYISTLILNTSLLHVLLFMHVLVVTA